MAAPAPSGSLRFYPVSGSLRQTVALGATAVTTAYTLSTLLSTERLPAYRDLLFFVLPFKQFLAEHLRRGEIPLWNPYIYLGTPFLANFQSAVFYPPNVLLLLPFPLGFNLFLFLHYLIALGGIWRVLRHRSLSLTASAVGSLTFVIGGYLVSTMNLTNHLQGAVWSPWVLLLWMLNAGAPSARRFLSLTFLLTIQLLGGSPECVLMTLVLLVSWSVHRAWPNWRAMLRPVFTLTAALTVVAGLTAFQTLPTFEYLSESVRGEPLVYDRIATWSLEPISLLQLLLPHSSTLFHSPGDSNLGPGLEANLGLVQSLYLGIVPLCLAISGAMAGRERRLWGALLVGGLLLALGRHTPLLYVLYQMLPAVFGKFRYPEKFYFFVHFAASILAAEGAQQCLAREPAARRFALLSAVTFIAFAGGLVLLERIAPRSYLEFVAVLSGKNLPGDAFASLGADLSLKAERLVLLLGGLVVLCRLGPNTIRRATSCAALFALVAADLAPMHRDLNLVAWWGDLVKRPPAVDFDTVRASGFRVFHYQTVAAVRESGGPVPIAGFQQWFHKFESTQNLRDAYAGLWAALYPDANIVHHIPSVCGGDGLIRKSVEWLTSALERLHQESAVRLLRLFGVGYLIGPVPLDVRGLEAAAKPQTSSDAFVYRVVGPSPRVYLVSQLRESSDSEESLRILISNDFRSGEEAIVTTLPDGWRNAAGPPAGAGSAEILSDRDTQTEVRVNASVDAFLVLNDSAFPGWEATVDGEPAPIIRTNEIVRGVAVRRGEHMVIFRYCPRSIRYGAAITLLSLLLVAGAAGTTIARRPSVPNR